MPELRNLAFEQEEFGRKAWNEMNSGEDGALEQNRGGRRQRQWGGEAAVPTRDACREKQKAGQKVGEHAQAGARVMGRAESKGSGLGFRKWGTIAKMRKEEAGGWELEVSSRLI